MEEHEPECEVFIENYLQKDIIKIIGDAEVAQLVEHSPEERRVTSSNLVLSTRKSV